MFDITSKAAADTGTVELVEGDGAPLIGEGGERASITIYGPGSKIYQRADADRQRARIGRLKKNKGNPMAGLDDAREDDLKFLADITVSLNNFAYPGEFVGVRDMAAALYAHEGLGYIRDQVNAAAHDWTVFTQGSAIS